MKLMKEALGLLGALMILAVIVAFVAPRRARAVAALLAQIVPGTTTHVGQNESQLVSLSCFVDTSFCNTVTPEGGQGPAYAVPSGYTLIVTDWEWFGFPGTAGALTTDSLLNANGEPLEPALATSSALGDRNGFAYGHEHYTGGIRVGSGITIEDDLAAVSEGNAQIQGYLVPND